MKRTCKTCAAYDDLRQWCWMVDDAYCPDNKPACEHWILAAGKLTKAFRASLDKAREKHPVFLDVWPKAKDAEDYASYARFWKDFKNGADRLQAILYSEVNEFIAEVARGDFDRALEEAGDIMAVLYRALNEAGKNEQEEEQ